VFDRVSLTLLAALTILTPGIDAKDKKSPADQTDQIAVVGHIPVSGAPVRRFLATRHYSSFYLYAERDGGTDTTLIDVTNVDHPAVLAEVSSVPGGATGTLTVVSGTAALSTTETSTPAAFAAPQTIRILDYSDPRNPRVAREFAGVTAVSHDDPRGLIFLANSEGVWILQKRLAQDPEVNKSYEHYVIYGSSMYN